MLTLGAILPLQGAALLISINRPAPDLHAAID
jgi:hypothetical protein